MSGRYGLSLLLAALILGLPMGAPAQALALVDAHSQIDHFVDRSTIVPLMDEAGIRHVILSTRGKVKPEQLTRFAAKHPNRVTASVRTKGNSYSLGSPKYYKLLKKQLSMDGYGAMAEVIMWHAQKGDKAAEVVVPPDDKRVQTALKAALARGWPFVIHIEFRASQSAQTFMAKMEAMLRGHPDHPFALIHMGQLEAPAVARLLAAHKNLYFMTSHSSHVITRDSAQPWIDMFDGGSSLAPRWKALMVEYSDRFILNFDNVFKHHWGTTYVKQAAFWRKALLELPPGVAGDIAHGNAERLWKLPGAK